MQNRDVLRQIAIIVAVVATIGINMAAVFLPLNNLTTQELSDRYDILFVPAGYVFSIWTLIYLGLLAYAAYQAAPSRRQDPRLRSIAVPFLVTCAANCAWIFLWHYEHVYASVGAMLVLLAALIEIYRRLRHGQPATATERWVVDAVFSIYLGWISVATVANVSAALWAAGWRGEPLTETVWLVVMSIVAVALAALMWVRHRDWLYAAVIAWALVGIVVELQQTGVLACVGSIPVS